jgi:1-acyl-sn-glycerol-3-phosphate acyltransferase
MAKLRFYKALVTSLPYAVYAVPKADYMIAHKDVYNREIRYQFVREICKRVRLHAATKTKAYGTENLPETGGYILYSNHQGKYDALGIINCHKKPLSVLWEEKSAARLIAKQVARLLDSKTISFTDRHSQIKVLNEVSQEVAEGNRYLIFPEGGYTDNRNELQEFKSGCFLCALKSQVPIVPVAIYDSWKSMDTNHLGWVRTQVHYLKPIYYEEYGTMNRKEVCALVKERIEWKLKELREYDK